MMKISLEVCQGYNCLFLCVMKPGDKIAWMGGINTTEDTYYCCNRHLYCTEFNGIPPIRPKCKFEEDDVPKRCEMMAEYKLREWNDGNGNSRQNDGR
jgi:hypothetical protein